MATTGGGFLLDDLSSLSDLPSHSDAVASSENTDPGVSSVPPHPLSAKQEARLRSYLDNALLVLSRGYRKRFDPSAPLSSLVPFLQEWTRIYGVLANVQPYSSGSTNLLVSYLLRGTAEVFDGVAGYGLGMEVERIKRGRKRRRHVEAEDASENGSSVEGGAEGERHEQADSPQEEQSLRTRQLNLVLETLDLLDRMWTAILRGHMVNYPLAQQSARRAHSDVSPSSSDVTEPSRTKQAAFRTRYDSGRTTSILVPSPAIDGRFRHDSFDAAPPASARESLPIQGGRGMRTVGQTDRVRLRNIAVLGREKLFAWMREELNAPLPPMMDENDDVDRPSGDADAATGDVVAAVVAEKLGEEQDQRETEREENMEGEMEDVPIDSAQADPLPVVTKAEDQEEYDPQQDTEEHQHFQQLFDRKIDPDADDSDAPDSDHNDHSTRSKGKAPSHPTRAAHSSSAASRKRRHSSSSSASSSTSHAPTHKSARSGPAASHSEMASVDVDLHSDSVAQWDLAFARIFSKTLKTLSDLTELGGEADGKAASRTDRFTTVEAPGVGIGREDEAGSDDDGEAGGS